MYIERNIRMVKNFLKINTIKSSNCILNAELNDQIDSVHKDSNATNWASNVRDILQSTGLNEVWLYPSLVRIDSFVPVLRSRLRDIYVSNWRIGLDLSSALDVFRVIKLTFEQSSYLRYMENTKYRNTSAKFRLSSHKLNIEVGRHNNIPRNERKCTLCNLNK